MNAETPATATHTVGAADGASTRAPQQHCTHRTPPEAADNCSISSITHQHLNDSISCSSSQPQSGRCGQHSHAFHDTHSTSSPRHAQPTLVLMLTPLTTLAGCHRRWSSRTSQHQGAPARGASGDREKEAVARVHRRAQTVVRALHHTVASSLRVVCVVCRVHAQVVAYEQGPRPGGTWVYDTTTDSDALGAAAGRRRVHGSMYRCAEAVCLCVWQL